MRRLALHASALSDAEYELYTSSLKDLALSDAEERDDRSNDDGYLEQLTISVREARAWLRGRYSHVSAPIIDGILRLFSPNLAHGDTVSGSEFFAALRLVVHAENGKEVDRSLAFIQATPSGSPQPLVPPQAPHTDRPTPSTSQTSSPAKRHAELPPPMPTRRAYTEISIAPSSSKAPTSHNPFSVSDPNSHPQPPLHPSRSESSRSVTGTSQHSSHNPFVQRPPAQDDSTSTHPPLLPPRKPAPLVPPRHASSRGTRANRSISPSKSLNGPPSTANDPLKHLPPAIPPKLPHHVTSNLMKQSLQASKVAQSMKRAEEQLEKERVLQVLKSSSVVTGSYSLAGASLSSSSVVIGTNIHNQHQHPHPHLGRHSTSTSPARGAVAYAPSTSASASSASDVAAPPLPRRRQHPSPQLSATSLEQVALAAPPPLPSNRAYGRANSNPDYPRSPFHSASESPLSISPDDSPSRPNVDLPAGPPPTHPDRKHHLSYHAPSSSSYSGPQSRSQRSDNLESFEAIYGPMSSTTLSTPNPPSPLNRAFRSKSMHQTSPPIPPLPPPVRRKRPESVQVLSSGEVLSGSLTRSDSPTSPGLTTTTTTTMSTSTSTSTLSRHTSLSTPHRRSSLSITSSPHPHSHSTSGSGSGSGSGYDASPLSMTHIQRTIATLQPRLESLNTTIQPHLDKARYKAEAGLSKRGFVRDRSGKSKVGLEGEEEEGLMSMRGDGGYGVERGRGRGRERERSRERGAGAGRDSPDVDSDDYNRDYEDRREDDGDEMDAWRRGRGMESPLRMTNSGGGGSENVFNTPDGPRSPSSAVVQERDNLKWPAGEGWKPL